MVPGLTRRELVVRDGTRIGYQVRPGATAAAPVVVLSNGLGGTFEAFRHVYAALPGYRVLCWDYRGLYGSAAPAAPRAHTARRSRPRASGAAPPAPSAARPPPPIRAPTRCATRSRISSSCSTTSASSA